MKLKKSSRKKKSKSLLGSQKPLFAYCCALSLVIMWNVFPSSDFFTSMSAPSSSKVTSPSNYYQESAMLESAPVGSVVEDRVVLVPEYIEPGVLEVNSVEVYSQCEQDSDGDGINDCEDDCPYYGETDIDESGCAASEEDFEDYEDVVVEAPVIYETPSYPQEEIYEEDDMFDEYYQRIDTGRDYEWPY